MKKALYLILALTLVFSLTACGGSGEGGEGGNAGGAPKTLADVYALETEDFMESFDPEYYACVYAVDGIYTRVTADMPEGLYDQVNAISFEDETRDDQVKELMGPIEIKEVQDISSLIPDEDACSELVGMTAKELQDAGYELTYYTVYEGQILVNAVKDYAAFLFSFEGDLEEDDEAWLDKIADLEVVEVATQGFDYTILDADFVMP